MTDSAALSGRAPPSGTAPSMARTPAATAAGDASASTSRGGRLPSSVMAPEVHSVI
ncbi:MAG TPA: hypothetical protein PLU22_03760 [Polyangiaceae bacterium]|nr:hypothetical protein [Polyangiaceae bacterium]